MMPNKDEIEAVCKLLDGRSRTTNMGISDGDWHRISATMLRTLAEENTALRAISIGLGLDKEEAEARAVAAEEALKRVSRSTFPKGGAEWTRLQERMKSHRK